MKRFHLIVLAIFLNISFTLIATAQASYADYKIDELTDAQILQMVKQAESIGYSDAQLEQLAAAKGLPASEMQKLRARVNKLNGGAQALPTVGQSGERSQIITPAPSVPVDSKSVDSRIFGSELFRNGNISFEPNLRIATPKNYIIGPDDKLLIDLTGDNEAKYELPVSVEGVISMQYVGRISVGGLTIEQASRKIRNEMEKTYPSLSSGRTSLAINIGNIRSIRVTITGNAVKTGTYTLSSLATVYNALYACGGPSQNGTFRNIQVIRGGKVVSTIDVYNFLLKGIAQNNITLQDQDVINIPVFEKRVEMAGQVKQPALFEVKGSETLQDLIDFAGGFTTQAYTAKIKSSQNTDKERRLMDIDAIEYGVHIPKNGDFYLVDAILDRFENRVTISGAVFRPREFELDKGLTLKGLIAKADGLKEDAFLNRGYISRLNADNTSSIISFDLTKLYAGTERDILLQREDVVSISSIFDLRETYTVSIQGEVRNPITLTYADNMTLQTAIQMAGGFKEGANPSRIEVSRRVKNADSSATSRIAEVFTVNVDKDLKLQGEQFILKPFDIITIYNAEGYEVQRQVRLEGEVVVPGLYTIISKNEKISDLIKRAGGLTALAYAEGASLKRPGANVVSPGTKNAINDGDEKQKTITNLKRVEQSGKDSVSNVITYDMVSSDLVGIELDRILADTSSRFNLIVENGDVIRIPRLLQTVKVSGEVLNPNNIVYNARRGLKSYIKGAGGFTASAKKGRLYVKYANGSAEGVSYFLFFKSYPQIKPGAEILVPKKLTKEGLSAQAWIGVGTAVASLGAIIVSLLR